MIGGAYRATILTLVLSIVLCFPSAPWGSQARADLLGVVLDAVGGDGSEILAFDEPKAGESTRVVLATRIKANPDHLRRLLTDPAVYRRAVPSFRRAEIVERRGDARLLRWELEVPLWNLSGKLWLEPRPNGVDLTMAEGDLAPGLFRLTVEPQAAGCILRIEARSNVREANFVTRRLAARSPFAEPAMTAAAALVLMRALALEAVRKGDKPDPRRWPVVAIAPPSWRKLDATSLARAAQIAHGADIATPLPILAAIHSRADGRLSHIEVAVTSKLAAETVSKAILDPHRWQALPGWRRIDVVTPPRGTASSLAWKVDWRFPFIDLDAVWSIVAAPPFRALTVGGDTRGAVMGWDLWAAPTDSAAGAVPRAATSTLAAMSMHPRLDKTGYIPRRLIEAEPLLEHGLSLGLAYVDAASFIRSLESLYGKQ